MNTVPTGGACAGATAAKSRALLAAFAIVGVTAAVALIILTRRHAPVPVFKSAPHSVQVVVEGLANNQPQVLWEALPPSYQADVREVIGTFCAKMDPNLYDRGFRVLNKAVKVLTEKEDFFAKSAVALSTPMLESSIGKNWRHDVGLLNALATSDLSSLARMKGIDPGQFLASTGHQLMAGAEQLRVRSLRKPGLSPWEKLRESLRQGQIEFVSTTNGQGYLKFLSATNSGTRDMAMTQVEGRWVPAEMAATWSNRMAQAKESMAKLNGPQFDKVKPMLSWALGVLDSSLDGLLQAGTQKEFDDKLKSLAAIGPMLRSLQELQKQGKT